MATEEVVHPQNISKDMLQSLFESAYMDTSRDSDGDLRVKDGYSFYVFPHKEGNRILLIAGFGAKPESSIADRLSFVNKVNDDLVVIRAYMRDNSNFAFDYSIPVEGGITKRAIVLATKFFAAVLQDALRKDEKGVVA